MNFGNSPLSRFRQVYSRIKNSAVAVDVIKRAAVTEV